MISAAALDGVLEGELVRLEPLRAHHGPGLVAAAEDEEMFRWFAVPDLSRQENMEHFVAAALDAAAAGREVPFAILSGERTVGTTRFLELRLEHLRAEIGWTWLARSVWGTGVNVEAKLLLLARAFEQAGLRRVEFKTDARNARSRGALSALGAQFEGILRKHMVRPDRSARDSAYFSVIDDEWPEVRAGLRRRLEGALRVEEA